MSLPIGNQASGERVLAGTAAKNENSHDVKGLPRVAPIRAERSGLDYFVDVYAEVRLESAFTVIA